MLGYAWRQRDPIGLRALAARTLEGGKPYRNLYQTVLNLYIPADVSGGMKVEEDKRFEIPFSSGAFSSAASP